MIVQAKTFHGFTLIELLVVISIIALLISILLPSLASAREAGRRVKCASNEHQMYIAFMVYADYSEGYVPPLWNARPSVNKLWWQLLRDTVPEVATPLDLNQLNDSSIFLCPSEREIETAAVNNGTGAHYSINEAIASQIDGDGTWGDGATRRAHLLLETAKTSKLLLVGDGEWYWMSPTAEAHFLSLGFDIRVPDYRHMETANLLYMDGHAGSAQRDEIPDSYDYPWIDPEDFPY